MARIVVKCPICYAKSSYDNKKKFFKCPICSNRVKLNECEIVEQAEEKEVLHGKWFHNHLFLGYFTFFAGIFGIDFFIKKCYKHGIISLLLCWTGASMIMGIFRGFEILALEDDEIDDYYKNKFH